MTDETFDPYYEAGNAQASNYASDLEKCEATIESLQQKLQAAEKQNDRLERRLKLAVDGNIPLMAKVLVAEKQTAELQQEVERLKGTLRTITGIGNRYEYTDSEVKLIHDIAKESLSKALNPQQDEKTGESAIINTI